MLSRDTWFYTMVEDSDNPDIIWANGWEQGFNRFNLKTGEHKKYLDFNSKDNFTSLTSLRLIRDRDNKNIFWIATWGDGLEKFDKRTEEFIHYQTSSDKNSISSNTVFDVFEDSRGNFWVATDKGLNLFDKNSSTFIKIELNGARSIQNIQEDSDKNIWFATDIGLIKFNPISKEVLKIYTEDDGLPGLGFFATARGKTIDGELWYGGMNGLVRFHPSTLLENRDTNRVVLTSLTQNGEPIPTEKALSRLKKLYLSADKNLFEFEYIALNFTNSFKNRYMYMLEEYDRDWYDAGTEKKGRYVNLPAGQYTLRVKGSNSDFHYSTLEQSLALEIEVERPWYKTLIAYLLYIVVIAGLIFYIIKARVRMLERKNAILEEKVSQRTAELVASKDEVEKAHQNIKDSINYASIIQEAILPEKTILEEYFRDNFIFWQPRDMVGGDIYFVREVENGNSIIVMVIDGAGHGVPGAFVTMLVKAIETQMVADLNSQTLQPSPANILKYFNIALKVMLKQDKKSKSRAGFDGGVLYYNRETKMCKYAGAKTPLYIIRENEEMEIIKSDRINVGFPRTKIDQEYTEYDIEIERGMQLYMATDGIVDQEGVDESRFGKTKLENLIQDISNETMDRQSEIIKREFNSFQGDMEQSDDVTIVGVKF